MPPERLVAVRPDRRFIRTCNTRAKSAHYSRVRHDWTGYRRATLSDKFHSELSQQERNEDDVEIIDDVRAIVAKSLKIPIERLTPATRLEELGAESLDVIEIVFGLEQKFDISIPFMADEGARAKTANVAQVEFATIGDLANVVKKLIEAKASR